MSMRVFQYLIVGVINFIYSITIGKVIYIFFKFKSESYIILYNAWKKKTQSNQNTLNVLKLNNTWILSAVSFEDMKCRDNFVEFIIVLR